jgi:hypothetical protein
LTGAFPFAVLLVGVLEGFSAEDLLPFKLARSASMMSMTLPLVREARFSIGWPIYFF